MDSTLEILHSNNKHGSATNFKIVTNNKRLKWSPCCPSLMWSYLNTCSTQSKMRLGGAVVTCSSLRPGFDSDSRPQGGMSFTFHSQCLVVFPSGFSSTLRRARNCSDWKCLVRPTGLARTCSGWGKINGFTHQAIQWRGCHQPTMGRGIIIKQLCGREWGTITVEDTEFPVGGDANRWFWQIFLKPAWNCKNLDPEGASKILLCRYTTASCSNGGCGAIMPTSMHMKSKSTGIFKIFKSCLLLTDQQDQKS